MARMWFMKGTLNRARGKSSMVREAAIDGIRRRLSRRTRYHDHTWGCFVSHPIPSIYCLVPLCVSWVVIARHGQGIYWMESGGRYEGQFCGGVPHGEGKTWSNGKLAYHGSLQSGPSWKRGRGTFYREDGTKKYEGDWEDGSYASGKGTLYFCDGVTVEYEGEWKRGMTDGYGTSYHADGKKCYEGNRMANHKHGQGTSYYNEGTTKEYEGQWVQDKWHGQGVYWSRDGSLMVKGTWVEGVLQVRIVH